MGKSIVSSGNGIYEVVPGARDCLYAARRSPRGCWPCGAPAASRALAIVGALIALTGPANAGPYSTGLANTTSGASDAGIPGFVGPAGDWGRCAPRTNGNVVNPLFVGWATSVVAYVPAPGCEHHLFQSQTWPWAR